MMKDLKRVDLWVGVGLMALSIAVWLMTASLPVPERGIGPGQYPRVISVMMFGLGAIQIGTSLRGGLPERSSDRTYVTQIGRALLLAVISLVYVRLLNLIGFPLLTPFFLVGIIRLFGYKKWKTNILVSVIGTAVIFVLFNIVFMVFLPVGRLF